LDGGAQDAATADAGPEADAAPPLSLQVVPGDLVLTEGAPGDVATTNVFSLTADGSDRHRLTRESGGWTFAAVGPDARYVAAVRSTDADGDGRPDAGGRRAVWVIDVLTRDAYAVTPDDCDAGIGGVGWRDAFRILLAMKCGDEPSAAYLVNRDNRGRERANLLQVSDHMEPVRDVFPAVNTPIYAYVVDSKACQGRDCVVKPQIWIADPDSGVKCRVTDGDPAMRDAGTVTGGEVRLGDHEPAFNGDVTSIAFSRNVAGKPTGPEGHLDLFRVGIDVRRLYAGEMECGMPDTLTRLSDTFVEDAYDVPGGARTAADERFPVPAAGMAPQGTILLTAQARDAAGHSLSQVFLVDVDGSKHPLTTPQRAAGYARWIADRYGMHGDR
jgi:hypothetical protein